MKEKKNKVIWLFFILSLILFARLFLSLVNLKNFNPNLLRINKYDNYSLLFTNNPLIEERLITWAVFLNKEDSDFYLYMGDYFQKKGDFVRAEDFYQKAIYFSPLKNYEIYKKQLEVYQKLNKDDKKGELLLSLLEKIGTKKHLSGFTNNLAKDFYLLGIRYFEKGDLEKTIFYWGKARTLLAPWSYFHLELASLYFNDGNFYKAKEILQACLKFEDPKEHCQSYINSGMARFWREKILGIEESKIN